MRQGLRSSSLKRRGDNVDTGHVDGSVGMRRIVDLNIEEVVVVSSEEGGEESCCEVRKTDGMCNVATCVGETFQGGEDKCVGAEKECGKKGFGGAECRLDSVGSEEVEGAVVSNVDLSLKTCSTVVDSVNKIDNGSGTLGRDSVMSGEEEVGMGCAGDSCDQVLRSNSGTLEGVYKCVSVGDAKWRILYRGIKEEVLEKDVLGANEVDGEALCSQVIVMSGADDKHGVADIRRCNAVDDENDDREDHVNCADDLHSKYGVFVKSPEKIVGDGAGPECKFDEDENMKTEGRQGTVIGKVLRSRIVPASGIGEDSGGVLRRKRGTGGLGDEAAIVTDGNDKRAVDSERKCNNVSPKKSISHFEEQVVQIHAVLLVPNIEAENAKHMPVSNSEKRKRGRPRKYVGSPKEEVVHKCKGEVEPEVEDRRISSKSECTPKKKGKRGRPKKLTDHPVREVIQKNKVQVVSKVVENSTNRSFGRLTKKGKRGRPRKFLHYPEEFAGCQVEEITRHVSRKFVGRSTLEHKCGRSMRSTGSPQGAVVQTKKVSFCDVDDEVEDAYEAVCRKSCGHLSKKRQRGRPKRQESNGVMKMTFREKCKVKNDRKMKASLVTAPVRKRRREVCPHRVTKRHADGVPSNKRILSDEKNRTGGLERSPIITSSKDEEAPFPENNLSGKRKRVETVGSSAAEKNLIRKRIVDMLLDAGWRVEYRPRLGKVYHDAVYVNPEGKTHWSVTKAYYTLKKGVEGGNISSRAGKSSFCFTPVPEEVLSKLFKVITKTRSDKNKKKKHKKDVGDSSDEEFFRDKPENAARSKGGAKHGHPAAKRKSLVQDGTKSKKRCVLLVRHSNRGFDSEGDGIIAYSGKHSVLAWMIDSGTIPLDGKVQCMNRRKTKSMLEGSITRDGIHCSCCNKVVSVAEFENHAGSKLCELHENVYLESGCSLLQCQLDSWNKQEETDRTGYHCVPLDGDDPSDDTCGICGDGGDLVCCDGCPSTFHHGCLNIEELPSGEWYCAFCSCKFCGGVVETELERDDDCDVALPSLITCSLCDKKYHQSCVDKVDTSYVQPRQPTFCGRHCEQIFVQLQSFLGAKHDLGDGFSWTLLQRPVVKADAVSLQPHKIISNSKLAVAFSVMDECFLPIIDPRSGINLIRHVVYNCGSNFNRLNFCNFFAVILERGDEVISAASIRIHGKGLAEMPFIGTRNVYRRQGMCRRLLNAIELALGSLDIQKLVIPAIPELMHTWTHVFGFKPLEESVQEEMKSMSMLVFPYTGMLEKRVSKQQCKKTLAVTEENVKYCESENEPLDVVADESEVDNGCMDGMFDLNCVASDLPESSSDERHLAHTGSTSGNCEDDERSGIDLGDMVHTSKVEAPSNSKENDDHQAVACDLLMSCPEQVTLQPDLNLMEKTISGNGENLDSPEPEKREVSCSSANVNSDKVLKSTQDSSSLALQDNALEFDRLTKLGCASEGTNRAGLPSPQS